MKYPTVRLFIEMSINLMKCNEMDSAVLNYAIKLLSKKDLTKNAEIYFIKTVFHLSLVYPYLIPLLDKHIFEKFSVSKKDLTIISNLIYEKGMTERNFEAVTYSIFFALKHDLLINSLDVDMIIASEDCITLLVSSFLFKKYGDVKSIEKLEKIAREFLCTEYKMESNWLFVYEILNADELEGAWKSIKKGNVSFVNLDF